MILSIRILCPGVDEAKQAKANNLSVDVIRHFVIDRADADLAPSIAELGVEVVVTNTVMKDREDKRALADEILGIGGEG